MCRCSSNPQMATSPAPKLPAFQLVSYARLTSRKKCLGYKLSMRDRVSVILASKRPPRLLNLRNFYLPLIFAQSVHVARQTRSSFGLLSCLPSSLFPADPTRMLTSTWVNERARYTCIHTCIHTHTHTLSRLQIHPYII